MSDKRHRRPSKVDVGVDIVTGAAAAMMYTEEEIRDVFSPEDAEEFLELRRSVREQFEAEGYGADNGDSDFFSLAAEDEAGY